MLSFPNAKINIGLSVIEKRPDNYHNIDTLFYPIPLSDILEIIPAKSPLLQKVTFRSSGLKIPGNSEHNLCVKAFEILDSDFDLPPVEIILHKVIPSGAGLGGGSSDATHTIQLLNVIFELGLDLDKQMEYASRLGSDCAFFVLNTPSIGSGKGDILKSVNLNMKNKYLILVKPPVFVSTSEAYESIIPQKRGGDLKTNVQKPIENWNQIILNDFEEVVFDKYPMIRTIKDLLYAKGALYASMSGSGSCVYGIFMDEINLKQAFPDMFYWGGWL